ncbi:MAG: hypothetical protein BIFFINMI_02525 [Phycisphaerae bacterium]|nr:hypothetical protein [Phycisphaerae bacterium]
MQLNGAAGNVSAGTRNAPHADGHAGSFLGGPACGCRRRRLRFDQLHNHFNLNFLTHLNGALHDALHELAEWPPLRRARLLLPRGRRIRSLHGRPHGLRRDVPRRFRGGP